MPNGQLKNYKKYLEKLEIYSKAVNLKLKYGTVDGGGVYLASRSVIKIDDDLEEDETIATILHELGHALDDQLVTNPTAHFLYYAYKAVYANEHTKKQLKKVVECEIRAWNYGRVIARLLKIPLGTWYDLQQKECVAHYRKE